MEFYASPEEEIAAIRRAAARSGCGVQSLNRGTARLHVVEGISRIDPGGDVATLGDIMCADGWGAARLLLALAIEDSRTPGARMLAARLRGSLDDESFARAVHAFVSAIPFVREKGEIFQSGAITIGRNAGDCDDHFRLAYALGVAGGLRSALGVLFHGKEAPPSHQGPAHAAALFYVGGGWQFAETTVAARFGEHPNDAARRLGLTSARSDIAKETRIMTEQDLPPAPDGYRKHVGNSAAQVSLDAQALQLLGYLAADAPAAQMTDPTFTVLRRAVLAFQLATGLAPDGLLGPHTRAVLGSEVAKVAPSFDYHAIGEVVGAGASAHLSDDFLRLVAAMADRFRAQGAKAAAEDFLQVWTYESGIANVQTNARNAQGVRYSNAGINQMGSTERKNCGFTGTLEDWLALSLEAQMPFVDCFYRSAAVMGGGAKAFRDAGAVYVATFAPAFLGHSGEPNFPLYSSPSENYRANRGLDVGGKGYISVDDMRLALQRVSRSALFLDARARIRALGAAPAAPSGGGSIGGGAVASLLFLGVGGGLALAYSRGWL